ncbi:hypothetical protein P170DRAFT_245785 [Aspergillus steynii IBT 23096]|uniref:Uncharacterized protein n=1 Tax=Aspergillus steynii IBT 23096 TaxID=1392250 RepID=A0A2I2FY19_9EURO|nr:uncharacterized protein P170DRAFT_245785 [Aspergillus steynii IBT 23096]PLB45523.1 hypothetical protein P170DRAFT_245785 [Aspergillus steynii IBT 23096]
MYSPGCHCCLQISNQHASTQPSQKRTDSQHGQKMPSPETPSLWSACPSKKRIDADGHVGAHSPGRGDAKRQARNKTLRRRHCNQTQIRRISHVALSRRSPTLLPSPAVIPPHLSVSDGLVPRLLTGFLRVSPSLRPCNRLLSTSQLPPFLSVKLPSC